MPEALSVPADAARRAVGILARLASNAGPERLGLLDRLRGRDPGPPFFELGGYRVYPVAAEVEYEVGDERVRDFWTVFRPERLLSPRVDLLAVTVRVALPGGGGFEATIRSNGTVLVSPPRRAPDALRFLERVLGEARHGA